MRKEDLKKATVSKPETPKGERKTIMAILVGEPEAGRTALDQAWKQAETLPKLDSRRGEEVIIKRLDPTSSTKYHMSGDNQRMLGEKSLDAALICVDLSKRINPKEISGYIQEVERYTRNQDIKIIIVGTKRDMNLDDAELHDKQLRAVANEIGMDYASCSKDDLDSVLQVAEVVKRAVAPPKVVIEQQAEEQSKSSLLNRGVQMLRNRFHTESKINLTVSGLAVEKKAHLQIIPTGADNAPVKQRMTQEEVAGKEFMVLQESLKTPSGSTIEARTSEEKPGVVKVDLTVVKNGNGVKEAVSVVEKITRHNPEASVAINKSDNSKLAQDFTDALAKTGVNLKSADAAGYKPAGKKY